MLLVSLQHIILVMLKRAAHDIGPAYLKSSGQVFQPLS